MKQFLVAALLLISLSASADNPPLPCGTWQQGGILIGCDLYQGTHPLPREQKDCWKFTNTRPGIQYRFSFGWFYLQCDTGTPITPVPLDDYEWALVPISALIVFIYRRKIFYPCY